MADLEHRRPGPEHQTCRECGATFDLAAQNYYDNVCPSCVDEERTWPLCAACSKRVDPDEAVRKFVNPKGSAAGGYLTYHPGCVPERYKSPRGPRR